MLLLSNSQQIYFKFKILKHVFDFCFLEKPIREYCAPLSIKTQIDFLGENSLNSFKTIEFLEN